MTIEELENKHYLIDEGEVNIPISFVDSHAKLSIEFAISVLEEVNKNYPEIIHYRINDKIQELKQYLK